MSLPIVLWAFVWLGMYSDLNMIGMPDFLTSVGRMIQGTRSLLPILAALIAILIMFYKGKTHVSLKNSPLWYLFLYALIGGFFFFVSPQPLLSLYVATLFLSPILVTWASLPQDDPQEQALALIRFNAIFCAIMTIFFFFGPMRPAILHGEFRRLYDLPFGLGVQTSNGMGRFACVAGLLALSRLATKVTFYRLLLWSGLLGISFLVIVYSISRTAILGFGVAAAFLLLINRRYYWLIPGIPLVGRYLYLAWFEWRFKGSIAEAFLLSGRSEIWKRALEMSLRSPLFGFGFHADRFLLEGEHVHMAYLHALIQSGVFGAIFFIIGFLGIWNFIFRKKFFSLMKTADRRSRGALNECLAILAFLTVRSFFESTAAFYGVDLLIFVPTVAYVYYWTKSQDKREDAAVSPGAPVSVPGEGHRSA
jgi:hypothetical protein